MYRFLNPVGCGSGGLHFMRFYVALCYSPIAYEARYE